MSPSSSTIWLASSRVGASTRATGWAGLFTGLDALSERHPEGERLARAGGRLDEHVAPGEDVGEHQSLDGKRLVDAAARERGGDRG